MRKTVLVKIYGRRDPKQEEKRLRYAVSRPVRKPHPAGVITSVKDSWIAT